MSPDARDHGRARAVPRPLLQLVRHAHARAAAPRVRLDGGHGQPRGTPARAARRPARGLRGAAPPARSCSTASPTPFASPSRTSRPSATRRSPRRGAPSCATALEELLRASALAEHARRTSASGRRSSTRLGPPRRELADRAAYSAEGVRVRRRGRRVPRRSPTLRRAVGGPSRTARRLAPWAPAARRGPGRGARERYALLAPLLEYVPSLVGLAEGLCEALAALDALAAEAGGTGGRDGPRRSPRASATARPTCDELLARLRLRRRHRARDVGAHRLRDALRPAPRSSSPSASTSRRAGSTTPTTTCSRASAVSRASSRSPRARSPRSTGSASAARSRGRRRRRALVSWCASMFEYLMPLLVMRAGPTRCSTETYETVVRRQIQYGAERGVPWGVSESAFNAKDAELTYQYQAFGVPGLGLKRGLSDDVVVAPYATMLALMVDPRRSLDEPAASRAEGAEGRYGFYESIDYTPGRVPAGQRRAIVQRVHGAPPGHGVRRARQHADRRRACSEPLPRRTRSSARPSCCCRSACRDTSSSRSPHVEEVEFVRSVRELPAAGHPLVPARRHARPGHPLPLQRPLLGHGHERGRRIQPLERSRGHPLPRGHHPRLLGQFFYVRDVETRRRCGRRRSSPHPTARRLPRAPSRRTRPSTGGATATSRRTPRSSCRPRTTSRSAASPSRTTAESARSSRSPRYFEVALARRRAATRRTRRSRTCSSRPRPCGDCAPCCSPAARAAPTRSRVWGFHSLACEQAGVRLVATRPTARRSSAGCAASRRARRASRAAAAGGHRRRGARSRLRDPAHRRRSRRRDERASPSRPA